MVLPYKSAPFWCAGRRRKAVCCTDVGNAYGNFALATVFPRKEFTKEDYKKKLQDLELALSPSVVLLPAGTSTASLVRSSSGEFGDRWEQYFTHSLPSGDWLATSYLAILLLRRPQWGQCLQNPPTLHCPAIQKKREPVTKRVLEKWGKTFKKEAKTYRLRTQCDGGDENNTWTGNSTQLFLVWQGHYEQ